MQSSTPAGLLYGALSTYLIKGLFPSCYLCVHLSKFELWLFLLRVLVGVHFSIIFAEKLKDCDATISIVDFSYAQMVEDYDAHYFYTDC